jgi:hypothetical protein
MAHNKVQYPRGLSMSAFFDRYGSPQQCEGFVRAWRWPQSLVCPRCLGGCHSEFRWQVRLYFQCSGCRNSITTNCGRYAECCLLRARVGEEVAMVRVHGTDGLYKFEHGSVIHRKTGVRITATCRAQCCGRKTSQMTPTRWTSCADDAIKRGRLLAIDHQIFRVELSRSRLNVARQRSVLECALKGVLLAHCLVLNLSQSV